MLPEFNHAMISALDPAPKATAARSKHRQFGFALMPAALTALALYAGGPAAAEPLAQSERFQFELWAQNHCPNDTVVWVNVRLQIYNFSEERWYGRTTDGAFACKLEAEKAGYRAKTPL